MAVPGKPAFSPEQDAELARRKAKGDHPMALAVEFTVSIPTIYAAIKRHQARIKRVAPASEQARGGLSTPGDTRKSSDSVSVPQGGSGSSTPLY